MIHHGIDGVLEFENFTFHVDRNFARQIASRDGRCHFSDVSNLTGEVSGHGVHRVRKILPRSGDAGHIGLSTEAAFGADFAGHARHFSSKGVQLIHHRVDRFFEQQDFSADIDRDFLGKIAARDGGRNFGDISDLAGQVAGHRVDGVSEIFPRASDAGHLRLAAELAVRADFARYACHFGGKRAQLIDHRIQRVFEFENFALHVDRNLAR